MIDSETLQQWQCLTQAPKRIVVVIPPVDSLLLKEVRTGPAKV